MCQETVPKINYGAIPQTTSLSYKFRKAKLKFTTGRLLHIDILSIFFGLGSYLCISGIFLQLPLLVQALPEGWNLPSYFTVVAQSANLAPLAYTGLSFMAPSVVTEKRSIYFIMGLGLLSTILLANFWEWTTMVGGSLHSTALLALVFILASMDCTSRVLYLPFMSQFQPIYFASYLLGENLAPLVPSILALFQGVGGNPECRNGTEGLEALIPKPNFSVDTFFYVLFFLILISFVSFAFLNNEVIVNGARAEGVWDTSNESKPLISTHWNGSKLNNNGEEFLHPPPEEWGIKNDDRNISKMRPDDGLSQTTCFYLLLVQGFTCFWAFGMLPSIQSFSSLPYGNVAYHLSITLSNMTMPIVCLLAFFIPVQNLRTVSVGCAMGSIISGWILFLAIRSPNPPLVGSQGGEFILVVSWILVVALFTHVRVTVAKLLGRYYGKNALFWYGAMSQVGAWVGATISFFAVNYTNLFHPYFPCAS